jgi:hypothetical protein
MQEVGGSIPPGSTPPPEPSSDRKAPRPNQPALAHKTAALLFAAAIVVVM